MHPYLTPYRCLQNYPFCHIQLCVKFFAREGHKQIIKNSSLERAGVLGSFYFFCLFCTCDFFTLLCHIGVKRNLFCRKKIKRDFLQGRKNFAKELPDKHCALFQPSPILNCMLITRLFCIRRKSSRFLFPVITVSARNAWDHGRPIGKDRRKKKTPAFLESCPAKASSTNRKCFTSCHVAMVTSILICQFHRMRISG